MTCDEVRERLNEYVDGEMGGAAILGLRTHLLHCHTCRNELRETRALTTQLARMQGATASETPSRYRRVAVGLAIVLILMMPPLLSIVSKKQRAATYGQTLSVPSPTVTTAEGRSIRTVRYETVTHQTTDTDLQGPDLADTTDQVSIKYPNKQSRAETTQGGVTRVSTRDGDRSLAQGGGYGRDGKVYQCRLTRTVDPLISPDAFTQKGAEAGLLAADVFPNAGPFDPSSPVVGYHTETSPQGQKVITTKLKRALANAGVSEGILRCTIEAGTGLVSSWDLEVKQTYKPSPTNELAPATEQHYGYHTICERVEYNVELPDSLFGAEPPGGASVDDDYSPEGLKVQYESRLRGLEEEYAKSGGSDTWAKMAEYRSKEKPSRMFPFLYLIPQRDQEEIRAKLAEIGIKLSE